MSASSVSSPSAKDEAQQILTLLEESSRVSSRLTQASLVIAVAALVTSAFSGYFTWRDSKDDYQWKEEQIRALNNLYSSNINSSDESIQILKKSQVSLEKFAEHEVESSQELREAMSALAVAIEKIRLESR